MSTVADKTKMTTVYCHVNKINGKIYIGITTKQPEKRWGNNGIGYKPSGKSYESHFYNAIQKWGWDSFLHIILIENIPLYQAEIIERELIKKYDATNRNYGYNRALGGAGGGGRHKKVNQYDLDGKYIQTWDSINDAGVYINRPATNITACCKGSRKTLANYQWRFFDDVKNTDDIEPYQNNIKSILQYDLNGKFIKLWQSAREIYNTLGFQIDTVQAACCGTHASACGFQWRYVDNTYVSNKNISPYINPSHKQVDQFDLEGNYIQTWNSISKAEATLNIAAGGITHCCRGKYNQSGGYKWKYTNKETN